MRTLRLIMALLICSSQLSAQVKFHVIVPKDPIIAGESFRVQYVAENMVRMSNLTAPNFKGFRFVSGPEIYATPATTAEGFHLQNTIFTLQAMEPGKYRIGSAVAIIDGKTVSSNAAFVEVISQEDGLKRQQPNGNPGEISSSYLKPGEDPEKVVKANLFVKVTVDKKTCYTGEAVIATFKLYSRLQSRSEIVKNPGFYGFTVHDMVGLADHQVGSEKINGKIFDVHTIRQVQLYPLQAGDFTIDPMEIQNRVEFSRSAVSKKNEQEVEEGIHGNQNNDDSPSMEYFESSISTPAVVVHVKPVPAKNKPDEYTGATGRFTMTATLEKTEVARNEEGYLLVTLSGKGNFSQISAPVIQWPPGIEGFDPTVKETIDKMQVPLSGTKTFRYAFVSANPGVYEFPRVTFPYFNPDSNNYGIVSATPGKIQVSYAARKADNDTITAPAENIGDVNRKASMIAAIVVGLLVITGIIVWLTRRKPQPPVEKVEEPKLPAVTEVFRPATILISGDEKEFYGFLYNNAWKWLSERFSLSGTSVNKRELLRVANEQEQPIVEELMVLLGHCETGMYTTASLEDDKEALLERITHLLKQLE